MPIRGSVRAIRQHKDPIKSNKSFRQNVAAQLCPKKNRALCNASQMKKKTPENEAVDLCTRAVHRGRYYSPALAMASRKTLRSSVLTCNAVLHTSYNKNCPDMIAPDHTIRLGKPKNSPPIPRSSTMVATVLGIDARPGSRFIVLSTVSAAERRRRRRGGVRQAMVSTGGGEESWSRAAQCY